MLQRIIGIGIRPCYLLDEENKAECYSSIHTHGCNSFYAWLGNLSDFNRFVIYFGNIKPNVIMDS
jgi:hypothetical protein